MKSIIQMYERTYHLLAEKVKSLKSAQCLCAGLNVLEDNVCLAAHFARLHSHDIEDGTVGGEQGI